MNVLFCHDGPLRKDEGNNYYGTAHNDENFKRYYSIAEKLAVAIRVKGVSSVEAKSELSKITVNPFEVVECPNISNLKGIILHKRKAKEIIYKEVQNSDYVVTRLPSFIGNLAVDAAKILKKPYLVEMVSCPWDAFWNRSLKGKIIAPFMYYATKKRISDANYVVYVTNEYLQKKYPTKGKNTNCSNVSLIEFNDNILAKRKLKIENMQRNGKIVLGTTAAIDVHFKGQQFVINALGKLKKQGITCFEYQLVGGGDQKYLKSVAEKYGVMSQVKFLGSIPHIKIFEWLDTIDIYVQPSRQEGLPRALIEAMSRGVPAFGARTAGIPELLEDKYIFSNTKSNIDEICAILDLFDTETMITQSKRNYYESQKYEKNIIEERRVRFFNEFTANNS